MKSSKILVCIFSLILLWLTSCTNDKTEVEYSLKENFKNNYLIGVALSREQIIEQKQNELNIVLKEFNSVTPENMLKWERIHPKLNEYNFEPVDSFISFSQKNKMNIIGHVLVWHQQTPDWVFEDEAGNQVSKNVLLERMRNHIHKVVGNYKGEIHGWDVINEAFNDDGSFRKTKWLEIIGEEYIEKAFIFSNEADPEAELYYNDFNMWYPGKIERVIEVVTSLKEKGIRIDGIGLQGHWGLEYPTNEEIDNALKKYSDTNLKLMITELDMTVLPLPDNNTAAEISKNYELKKEYDPFPNNFPDSMQTKLSNRYIDFFNLFNKYKKHVTRVTFWGLHDGMSWKNNWPVKGRTTYPLLFDRELNKKPAYFEVIKTVKN